MRNANPLSPIFTQRPPLHIAGRLEEALERYNLSKKYGVERAAVHIRNVSPSPINASTTGLTYGPQVGAKILAKQVKETEKSGNPKSQQ